MVGNNPVGLYDMYGLGFQDWLVRQEWIQPVADFSAGMGDRLSGGLTRKARKYLGYDDAVDYDSAAYGYGEVSGMALNTAIDVASAGGLGRQLLQCRNYAEVVRLAAMLGASQATALLERMALDSVLAKAICSGYLSPREAEAIRMALEAATLAARYRGAWRSGQRRCFAAGTLVLMADGQFTPIEEIGRGDLVLACVDGEENVPSEVTDVFRGETLEWVDIAVAGQVVRATPGHLFRVGGEWVEARNLRAGMNLQDAYFAGQVITEVSIACLTEPEPTYNLAIRVGRTYYVSEAAILAHNGCNSKKNVGSQSSEQYEIGSYKEMHKKIQGKNSGLETHHLIEKRFAGIFGVKQSEMPSINIPKDAHRGYTNAWRNEIGYGDGTEGAKREYIINAYKKIYKGNQNILNQLKTWTNNHHSK